MGGTSHGRRARRGRTAGRSGPSARSPAIPCASRASRSRRSAPAVAASPGSIPAARCASGPQSAGAHPGPACYGRGGTAPTVTDANVVLGRLSPTQLLDGRMTVRRELAEQADRRARRPARRLGRSRRRAGIVSRRQANMLGAIRVVSVQQGLRSARLHAGGLRRRGPAARGRAGSRARHPSGSWSRRRPGSSARSGCWSRRCASIWSAPASRCSTP